MPQQRSKVGNTKYLILNQVNLPSTPRQPKENQRASSKRAEREETQRSH